MNKQAFLEETYNSAFEDELEKISGEVKIPKGGLKPGLLINDMTQVMTPEDAKMIKEKKNVFMRSGPGILPSSLSGYFAGGSIANLVDIFKGKPSKGFKYLKSKPALAGALALPTLLYSLSRLGAYDKGVLRNAKKLIDENS